ncbi:MAG TPA: helix-turn-helix domain-containing protein [Dyella sp.]|uniref:helix-turn-helix domain-containing protein n=1 Tax=Dyella sp. TaxID=1869338 RepID=UPI002F953C32
MSSTKKRAKPAPRAPKIDLNTKQQPTQQRSVETFELILEVTSRLLGEVGVERLSTNMVCEKAGISPPALYRYFPNKYAILKELGERLMACQNRAYREWLEAEQKLDYDGSREASTRGLRDMQARINAATLAFPGSAWIMRALRAVPTLRHIRLDSHESVSQTSYQALRGRFPHAGEAELRLSMRLSTEVMYAATEMVIDNPQIDGDLINAEVADMVVRYYDKFVEREAVYTEALKKHAAKKSAVKRRK